jgi:DNA ligase-associated metallophosphoesterase
MVPLSFGGQHFLASSSGALFWPAQEALLVADLHLEKASWFARLGQFLPPYDSHATLTELAEEIAACGASRLYCLGDSFHDRFGCDRLSSPARQLLLSLTSRLNWVWIIGNHDPMMGSRRPGDGAVPSFADHCGGRLADEVEAAGIVLRHEALAADPRSEISGHFHPKLRLQLRGRNVSRRCFVTSPTKLILPAYGSLTGGLDAHHPEIMKNVAGPASALVPLSDRLLRFPLAA